MNKNNDVDYRLTDIHVFLILVVIILVILAFCGGMLVGRYWYNYDNMLSAELNTVNTKSEKDSFSIGDKVQVNGTMIITGYNQVNPITNETFDYSGLLEDSLGTEYYYFNDEDIVTEID